MFTKESLKKLHDLSGDVKKAREMASELLRTAQDRYQHRTHKLTREGKEIELTEKVMWQEIFMVGPGCDSGKLMTTLHPEIFAAYKEQDKAADAIKTYCIKEFDIDYTQMTISDYLRMTEGMMALMLSKFDVSENNVKEALGIKENWFKRLLKKLL